MVRQSDFFLLTGCAGFIGSHVAELLVDCPVYGIDDLSTGDLANIPERTTLYHMGRYQDLHTTSGATVIHLAGIADASYPDDAHMWRETLGGTAYLLEVAARTGSKFVYASSAAAAAPYSAYGEAKRAAEQIVLAYGGTVLRYSNVYGLRQRPPAVLPTWIQAIREGRPATIHGDGLQTRDFIHVGDAARATVLAARAESPGVPIDICTGRQTSLVELATEYGMAAEFSDGSRGPAAIIQDPEPAKRLFGFEALVRRG